MHCRMLNVSKRFKLSIWYMDVHGVLIWRVSRLAFYFCTLYFKSFGFSTLRSLGRNFCNKALSKMKHSTGCVYSVNECKSLKF